jgi:hypothetical protein
MSVIGDRVRNSAWPGRRSTGRAAIPRAGSAGDVEYVRFMFHGADSDFKLRVFGVLRVKQDEADAKDSPGRVKSSAVLSGESVVAQASAP